MEVKLSSSGFDGDLDVSFDISDLNNEPLVEVAFLTVEFDQDDVVVFGDLED